jgi:hypothetical protein
MKKIFYLFLFLSTQTFADEFDDLLKTQQVLRDPSKRAAALQSDEAKKADQTAGIVSLGRSENKEALYGIAADIMPWLLQVTNSDPNKMMELLELAKSNPSAFYERLPAAEKSKIKNLANTIEGQRKSSNSKP